MNSSLTDLVRSQLHRYKYDKNPQDLKQTLESEGYVFRSFDNTKMANDQSQQMEPQQPIQQDETTMAKDPEEVLLEAITSTPSDYGLEDLPPSKKYLEKKDKELNKYSQESVL